jgi:hypothetical protein
MDYQLPPPPPRPYRLQPWAIDAARELLDILTSINEGGFVTPADIGDRLRRSAESIETVLNPEDWEELTPHLLDALGAHIYALHIAANEITALTHQPRPDVLARLQESGWEVYTRADNQSLKDLLAGTLHSLRAYQQQRPRIVRPF